MSHDISSLGRLLIPWHVNYLHVMAHISSFFSCTWSHTSIVQQMNLHVCQFDNHITYFKHDVEFNNIVQHQHWQSTLILITWWGLVLVSNVLLCFMVWCTWLEQCFLQVALVAAGMLHGAWWPYYMVVWFLMHVNILMLFHQWKYIYIDVFIFGIFHKPKTEAAWVSNLPSCQAYLAATHIILSLCALETMSQALLAKMSWSHIPFNVHMNVLLMWGFSWLSYRPCWACWQALRAVLLHYLMFMLHILTWNTFMTLWSANSLTCASKHPYIHYVPQPFQLHLLSGILCLCSLL